LWLGKGGWLRVSELKDEMFAQEKINTTLVQRNARLRAEVDDLIHGQAAIEERARFELGMIKKNEIFFQVMEPAPKGLTSGTAAP
jgi:cell division protein FtsB